MHANQLKTERRASKLSGLQGRRQEVGRGGGAEGNVTCFSRSTISGKQQLDMQRHRQTARQTKETEAKREGDRDTHGQWNKQANKHRTTTWNTSHKGDCWYVTSSAPLLRHCPPPPSTFLYAHFTQLHFPNISKHFRIVNAVAFYTFLFASMDGWGKGKGGNWRIKHVRGTICNMIYDSKCRTW